MKKRLSSIIAILLLVIVIALPIIFIIGLYSGGLLYFGITYEKLSDFVLLVIISTVLAGVLELLFKTLIQVCSDFKILNKSQTVFFKIILDLSANIISLLVGDYFMENVMVSFRSILLFSVFATGISCLLSNGQENSSEIKIDSALKNRIHSLLGEYTLMDTMKILREEHPELSMSQIKKIVLQINQVRE